MKAVMAVTENAAKRIETLLAKRKAQVSAKTSTRFSAPPHLITAPTAEPLLSVL